MAPQVNSRGAFCLRGKMYPTILEKNKIYHGVDSFEILPQLPDQCVDLVLTDPPYDFNGDQKWFLQEHFLRIAKGAVIVFSPPENQWILPADQYFFWVKPSSTKNTSRSYSRFVEMVFIYGRGPWNTNRHWSQYTNVSFDFVDSVEQNPFRKPPALIERLVLNHSDPGDLILDPFGGSFVVAEVAGRNSRDFMTWDIAPDYSKIRVNNGYSRMALR